ncbi:uncharacterized protein LOC124260922 [Haliotis rubra]|uniref:uncharacterized protein LOC124260922 n=1 Tax=Haliotis rubra TaxID=36100 RepID=UPI001EE5F6AD|nr:uncharacterized protein LOC124260922 [Haliotis rubra]
MKLFPVLLLFSMLVLLPQVDSFSWRPAIQLGRKYLPKIHRGIKAGCNFYRKYVGRQAELLDTNKDGRVDRSEAANYLGVDHEDEELHDFMNKADFKRDGIVDLDEFLDAAIMAQAQKEHLD